MKHICICGTEFEGRFCPNCGTEWQEDKTCPQCGTQLAGNAKFCNNCGYGFLRPEHPAEEEKSSVRESITPADPKPVFSRSRHSSLMYARVCYYLPAILFALFAVLNFLFFLAPVAVMPGGELLGETIPSESYGNVYQIASATEFESIMQCSVALIVFACILAVCSMIAIPILFRERRKRDLDHYSRIFFFLSAEIFSLAILIVSSVMLGMIGEADGGMGLMVAGAAPILEIVFSSIFGVAIAAVAVLKTYWDKHEPSLGAEYRKSVAARYNAKRAQREEHDRIYMETHAAPAMPEIIKKPKRPRKPKIVYYDILSEEERGELQCEVNQYIEKAWRAASIYPRIFGILVAIEIAIMTLLFLDGPYILALGITGVVGCLALVISNGIFAPGKKRSSREWCPEKVYCNRSFRIAAIEIVSVIFWVAILAILASLMSWYEGVGYVAAYAAYFIISPALLAILFVPFMLAFFLKYNKRRKALAVQMCGYTKPEKNSALVAQYEQDLAGFGEKKAAYLQEREAYKANNRAWVMYHYECAQYRKLKEYGNASYLRMWCSVKKRLLAVVACLLVVVIVVTSVLTTRDMRFSVDKLSKIGLGADEARVEEILGEADQKTEMYWYYYSKNYTSVLNDFKKLEEEEPDSMEGYAEFMEKYYTLQQKLDTIEHKVIVIGFDADKKVSSLLLDTCAIGDEGSEDIAKEAKTVTVSPEWVDDIDEEEELPQISYSICYEDGSYREGYFTSDQLSSVNFQRWGTYTVKFSDSWGSYTAEINVQ